MRNPFDPKKPAGDSTACILAIAGLFLGDVLGRLLALDGFGHSLGIWGMALGGSAGLLLRLRDR